MNKKWRVSASDSHHSFELGLLTREAAAADGILTFTDGEHLEPSTAPHSRTTAAKYNVLAFTCATTTSLTGADVLLQYNYFQASSASRRCRL